MINIPILIVPLLILIVVGIIHGIADKADSDAVYITAFIFWICFVVNIGIYLIAGAIWLYNHVNFY